MHKDIKIFVWFDRHASHDSVIQLLKNSGKSPTLLVQWRPLPENQNSSISPIRSYSHSSTLGPRQQQNEENSGSDSALESDISPRNGYRENVDQRRSMVKPEPDQKELLKHLKDQVFVWYCIQPSHIVFTFRFRPVFFFTIPPPHCYAGRCKEKFITDLRSHGNKFAEDTQ